MTKIRSLCLNMLLLLATKLQICDGSTSTVSATQATTFGASLNNTSSPDSTYLSPNVTAISPSPSVAGTPDRSVIVPNMKSTTESSSSLSTTTLKASVTTEGLTPTPRNSKAFIPSPTVTSFISTPKTSKSSMASSTQPPPAFTSPFIPSPTTTASSSCTSGRSDDDPEPKKILYVWQMVAIGSGAFVLILFIIIGFLCYQNQALKKKLTTSRNYSLPIKENGAWINNQDFPLWQKRASAFVSENPAETNAENPTLTT